MSIRTLFFANQVLECFGVCLIMSLVSEFTLFQRIQMGEDSSQKKLELDPEKLRKSIGIHLQDMFNTRQGAVLANPDYGLPDFNDIDMSNGFQLAKNELEKAIKAHLKQYEMRIGRVRVNYVKDLENPLNLRFEIKGLLNLRGQASRVRFEVCMDSEGAFKVTS